MIPFSHIETLQQTTRSGDRNYDAQCEIRDTDSVKREIGVHRPILLANRKATIGIKK